MDEIVLGIDIGSTKICALVARKNANKLQIIGAGFATSAGMKKGVITNIDEAGRAIASAVNEARRTAGVAVRRAIVSISGAYTRGIDSKALISLHNNEVREEHIKNVIKSAVFTASLPSDYDILHILPYNFKLDKNELIDNPLRMSGSVLEVFVRIITAQKAALSNLRKAVSVAGIEISNIVLTSYASSIAVLNRDEKNLGVACIDLGGSTCESMIHYGNSLRYDSYLGVGGYYVTTDLAHIMHCSTDTAEKVKIQHGSLYADENNEDLLEVPLIDTEERQQIEIKMVQTVICERVYETLRLLRSSLHESGLFERLGAGVVLTGGMTLIEGFKEAAANVFEMPVRIAKPEKIDGVFDGIENPMYSTAVGLVLYGAGHFTNYETDSEGNILFVEDNLDKVESIESNFINEQNAVNTPISAGTDLKQDLGNLNDLETIRRVSPKSNIFKRIANWFANAF